MNRKDEYWRAAIGDAIGDWRKALGYEERSKRADLAELRRLSQGSIAGGIDSARALGVADYVALRRRVGAMLDKSDGIWRNEGLRQRYDFDAWLAAVAGVLAWVRADSGGQPLGKALGQKIGDERRAYPEQRFKRLLRLDRPEELLREGQRLVNMLDRRAPVAELSRRLLFWNPTFWGHYEHQALALHYYDPHYDPRNDFAAPLDEAGEEADERDLPALTE